MNDSNESTFLQELESFIKENNLFRGSFNRIYISNKFLPASFRRAIVEKANSVNSMSVLDDSFILLYDDSKQHLCALFTFLNGKTNILVKDTPDHIYINERYTPYSLDDVVLDASKKDIRNDLYFSAVDSLKTIYSYPDEEARKQAAIKVDEILQSFSDKDFIESAKINESLGRITPIIKEYIIYISELYRTNVEDNNSEVIVMPAVVPLIASIIYKQNKSHRFYSDIQTRLTSIYSPQRVNEVIDYTKRQMLLKSLGPIVEGTCLNSDSDEIEYYVFLYRVSEEEYKFVFEPLSGKKCTKVVNFKCDKELSIIEIERLAKQYLSMTEEEIIESSYAARFNHTTEETYNSVIPYAIIQDIDKYKCPYGTKARIDALEYDESMLEKNRTL